MKKIIILLFLVVITSYSMVSRAYNNLGTFVTDAKALESCQLYASFKPNPKPTCVAFQPSSLVSKILCGNTQIAKGYVFSNSVDSSAYDFHYYCTDPPPPVTPINGKPIDCVNGGTGFLDSVSLLWKAFITSPSSVDYIQCQELAGLERGLTDLNDMQPPKPGQTKTCAAGDTVTYPETCSTRLLSHSLPILNSGGKSKLSAINLVKRAGSAGSPETWELVADVESTNGALTGHSQFVTEVPPAAVAQGVQNYMMSGTAGGVELTNSLVSAANGAITADTAGNLYTPSNGSYPLTANQTLAALDHYAVPYNQVSPSYMSLDYAPRLQTDLDYINADFQRIYDNNPSTVPVTYSPSNFNRTPFPITATSASSYVRPSAAYGSLTTTNPPNLATATQPLSATATTPATSTSTSTTTNTTTGSTTTTTTLTDLGSAPEMPPLPPAGDVNNFLPTVNPFSFALPAWFPTLPEPSCYYEVHTTIFQRPFDMAPCVPLQPLRAILQWAFGLLTIWVCFKIIFKAQNVSPGG